MKLRSRKTKKIRLMPMIFYMLPDDIIRHIFSFVVPVPYPLRSRLSERDESEHSQAIVICDELVLDLWNNSDKLWLE